MTPEEFAAAYEVAAKQVREEAIMQEVSAPLAVARAAAWLGLVMQAWPGLVPIVEHLASQVEAQVVPMPPIGGGRPN